MGVLPICQDPSTIQHQEGPSGDVYAMPQKTGKKKEKEAEAEAEVEEMSEEQKAALYSVPDRKGQKSKSEGVSFACIVGRADCFGMWHLSTPLCVGIYMQ